jgi:fused signal recognition particle receptor
MVFNWFRRSFDNADASKAEPQPAESVTPDPADAPSEAKAPAAPKSLAEMTPAEKLAWAKAAAQNIQKQQAEAKVVGPPTELAPEPAAVASEVEAPSEPTESVATASVEVLVQEAVTETAVAEPVAEPTVTPEAEISPEPEPSSSESVAEPAMESVIEPVTEPVAEPQASVPFWARAEEERLQRLERLQETAIVEPEPEPEPVATVSEPELILPDIDLDEAFLWSAEVLAAQGRRPDEISAEEITWLKRLRQGLGKTRLSLVNQLKAIVGQGPLNDDAVMEIEALLLQADVGVAATDKVIEALQNRMRNEVLPPDQAIAYLKTILRDMLDAPLGDTHNLLFVPEKAILNIWLMTGVNGAGKTTTIGKLAHVAKKSGYNTLIAAADTFRAAAVEQVKAWGARSEVEVIANPGKNTDPAAVVYDAIAAANSRHVDLLLVDTAGRLQNKKNLMDELAKIRRIVDKNAPDAKIEALLVLDATLGQNGLRQAEVFAEAANLSGVVLTKLDGTAKGGVALAVVEQLGLPIRFIGAGEGIEDLRPFSSYEFVEALLSG